VVKLNRIYTRTGDNGTTGLADGTRLTKAAARVRAMGSIEEANAALGVARLYADDLTDKLLAQIQNDLFDLGADLAVPESPNLDSKSAGPKGYVPLRIKPDQTLWLEARIDAANERLAPLTSFILPAGTALSAHLHVARTITRRAESDLVGLSAEDATLNVEILKYVNRLSDLLFQLARLANDEGRADVFWVPQKSVD
jgi:cob(I)alamin adenosyltransferase